MKWHIDEIVSWKKGDMMKLQLGEVTIWGSYNLMKWHIDEMVAQWKYQSMK